MTPATATIDVPPGEHVHIGVTRRSDGGLTVTIAPGATSPAGRAPEEPAKPSPRLEGGEVRRLLRAWLDTRGGDNENPKYRYYGKVWIYMLNDMLNGAVSTLADLSAEKAATSMCSYDTTRSLRCKLAEAQAFIAWGDWLVSGGHVEVNPFAALRAGSQANPDRAATVTPAMVQKLIDACPDAEWRALVALSRFGGLRVPSEALLLKWADVDLKAGRMQVTSPKTERHAGHGSREVPIFPELRPYLEDLRELAPLDAEFVVQRYRSGCNLNPQLHRIIHRAGLKAWPRVWHSMRGSRQTELVGAGWPLHVVCAFLGNSKLIASEHYLTVRPEDWARATAVPVAHPVAQRGPERTGRRRGAVPRTTPRNTR